MTNNSPAPTQGDDMIVDDGNSSISFAWEQQDPEQCTGWTIHVEPLAERTGGPERFEFRGPQSQWQRAPSPSPLLKRTHDTEHGPRVNGNTVSVAVDASRLPSRPATGERRAYRWWIVARVENIVIKGETLGDLELRSCDHLLVLQRS